MRVCGATEALPLKPRTVVLVDTTTQIYGYKTKERVYVQKMEAFIKNVSNLKHVLDVISTSEKYVDFSNTDGTIHYTLYANRGESGSLHIDVEYDDAYCEHNAAVWNVLSDTRCPDDDEFSSAMTYTIHASMTQEEKEARYLTVMEKINSLQTTKICTCRKRFIAAGEDVCLNCILTCPMDYTSLPVAFCAVCQESSKTLSMVKMACCSNYLHSACIDGSKGLLNDKCPYCRKQTGESRLQEV
jgi:hypothetical protein